MEWMYCLLPNAFVRQTPKNSPDQKYEYEHLKIKSGVLAVLSCPFGGLPKRLDGPV
jgi:hypothetical protein